MIITIMIESLLLGYKTIFYNEVLSAADSFNNF